MHHVVLMFDSRPVYLVLPFTASHEWTQAVFLTVFNYAVETHRYHRRFNDTTFALFIERVYEQQQDWLAVKRYDPKTGVGELQSSEDALETFRATCLAIAERYYDEFYGALTYVGQRYGVGQAKVHRLTPYHVYVMVEVTYLLTHEDTHEND